MKTALFLSLSFLLSCGNISVNKSSKWIGKWLYTYSSIDGKGDGSMDGQIATIKLMEGTKETFVVSYLYYIMNFELKDENTLKGISNIFEIKYIPKTGNIHFYISPTNYHTLKKLK